MIDHPSSKMKPIFPVKIVMVWSIVFLGIIVYVITWFTFSAVAMSYIEAIADSISFNNPWDNVLILLKNIIFWHPIIAIGSWLLYGFLASMKGDIVSWKVDRIR